MPSIDASTLVFDTRFIKEVEAHRNELKMVRHFIAIGSDAPDWAIPFTDVVAAGSAEEPGLDVDEDAPCSYSSAPARPAGHRG